MNNATAAVSPLCRRMIDDMSLPNLSPATQRSSIHAVKQYSSTHHAGQLRNSAIRSQTNFAS